MIRDKIKELDEERKILSDERVACYYLEIMFFSPDRDEDFDDDDRPVMHYKICTSKLILERSPNKIKKLETEIIELLKNVSFVELSDKIALVKRLPPRNLLIKTRDGYEYRNHTFVYSPLFKIFYRYKISRD